MIISGHRAAIRSYPSDFEMNSKILVEFLQEFPEPGRICQNDVNQEKCGEREKKNDKVDQKDAATDQNSMSHAHMTASYNKPSSLRIDMDRWPMVVVCVSARVR